MKWDFAGRDQNQSRVVDIQKFQVWMDERDETTINLEDSREVADCIRCFRVPNGGVLHLFALCLVLAVNLTAGTVYFTPKGKTYHDNPKCMALSRATAVLVAEAKEAIEHGLVKCGIEAHRKLTAAKKTNNAAWGKAVAK